MGSLDEDPWALAGTPLEGAPGRTLKRLREEGDEIETRQAWLERLAEEATCPVCSGALTSVEDRGATRIRCVAEGGISGGPEAEHCTSTPISMQAWVDSMGSGRERRLATPRSQ